MVCTKFFQFAIEAKGFHLDEFWMVEPLHCSLVEKRETTN